MQGGHFGFLTGNLASMIVHRNTKCQVQLLLLLPTNLVAVRCLSLKWKGTVMTASSMSFPPLAWAISEGKTVKLCQKNVNRLINNSIQFCTNLPFNHKAPLLAFCFSELGLKWGLLSKKSKLPNNLLKMILRTSLGEK